MTTHDKSTGRWSTHVMCAVCPARSTPERHDEHEESSRLAEETARAEGFTLVDLPHVTQKGHRQVWICRPCLAVVASASKHVHTDLEAS